MSEFRSESIVVRRPEANAVTLPGGHIYVFEGLIDECQECRRGGGRDRPRARPCHEPGRQRVPCSRRPGCRWFSAAFSAISSAAAPWYLPPRSLLKSAYSRHKEAAADDYAVRTMQALNANPRALATFLARIAGISKQGLDFPRPSGHPDRVARINAIAPPQSGGATLLDAAEWKALKRICAGYR